MINNLSISLSDLRKLRDTPISLEQPHLLSVEADLIVHCDQTDYKLENVKILELYTTLKEWLDNDSLDVFTHEKFTITSEDGERWFLEIHDTSETFTHEVDIDDLILELWKLNVNVEVKLLNTFKVDIVPKKPKK